MRNTLFKNKFFLVLVVCLAIFPIFANAQDGSQQTDWVIRDFQATITVNKDSSLLVEEKITADCDGLPGKHGIFRVLPTETKTEAGTFKTPVRLISITDFNNAPVKFSTTNDSFNHTVTWKIGNPDVTVSGLNYYKITYLVKNAIRFGNPSFDELYWNLSGNFWQIPIEKFSAKIIFPSEVNQNNAQIDYYTGSVGGKGKDLANYSWSGISTLEFNSTRTLDAGQGITASIAVPKNIFTPYFPGFWDIYGNYLWFLIPLLVFVICYSVWNKYGKDPRVDKTIIPEFEIPENLTPMEMGMLFSSGSFKNEFITSTIIGLAVKKFINIEEIQKTWILGSKDFKLTKIATGLEFKNLGAPETALVNGLFDDASEVLLSSLKKKFYAKISGIRKAEIDNLAQKGLIAPSGLTLKTVFVVLAFIAVPGSFFATSVNWGLAVSLFISAAMFLVFGLLMPKRTPRGAELNWRVKGFKLYMETAEKYRAQFNEKENIFEKFLPYAIMFGMTKLWIKKMEEIYGKEYFATYHPIWYAGAVGSFDADSFTSNLNSLSSAISSNMGTSSGAGGAGGAGGGGGGGGGGGW